MDGPGIGNLLQMTRANPGHRTHELLREPFLKLNIMLQYKDLAEIL